ncbi:MAG: hypothetical protein M1825_005961 [Sarcosagium campestre]|nr:MAG: hypothetical protein M1825_005961 [Sarcosagium campestre]
MADSLPQQEIKYQQDDSNADRGPGLVAFLAVAASIATIFVVLRIRSRRLAGISLKADDYTVLAALVFVYAQFICTFIQGEVSPAIDESEEDFAVAVGRASFGRHILALSPDQIAFISKVFYPWGIFYDINISLFKISILLLYRRVFVGPWIRKGSLVLIWFLVAFTITLVGKDVFACIPLHKQWEPSVPGYCINLRATYYWASAIFLLTDIMVLVMPMPLVWQLQISKKQKIGLSLIFGLGMVVTIATIFRLVVLILQDPYDVTYAFVPVVYWMGAESCLGITCACAATIRPILRRKEPGSQYSGSARNTDSSIDQSKPERSPNPTDELVYDEMGLCTDAFNDYGTHADANGPDHAPTADDPELGIPIPLHGIGVTTEVDLKESVRL